MSIHKYFSHKKIALYLFAGLFFLHGHGEAQPAESSAPVHFAYDAVGNLSGITDRAGHTVAYDYDGLNRMAISTDAAGYVTRYGYDGRDNLLSIVDANGHITRMEYTSSNELIKEIRPDGHETVYSYDEAWNLATRRDAKNQRTLYKYDLGQRLTQIAYFDVGQSTMSAAIKTVNFSYDMAGYLIGYGDGVNSSSCAYDAQGRKTQEIVFYGALSFAHAYTYDAAGQKTGITYPDGTNYLLDHAADGSLSSMRMPGTGVLTLISEKGRPHLRVYPGGAQRIMVYNAFSLPEKIIFKDLGGNPLLELSYAYDEAGNIIRNGDSRYTYDATNQLVGVQTQSTIESFGYDAVGNRVTHALGAAVTTATFNENNELEASSGAVYTYDDNGNTATKTRDGLTTFYAYDAENRLVRVTNSSGSLTATYQYDPFGRRISKTVNGVKTYFIYADEGLIAEANGNGVITKTYGWQPDGVWGTDPLWMRVVVSTSEVTGYFWYITDHLGAPQSLTAPNGAVAWRATCDVFGRGTVAGGAVVSNNLSLPGQYADNETGLHYAYHRYFDPETGRFMTVDPLGIAGQDVNLFRYVKNQPLNYLDPRGLLRIPFTRINVNAGEEYAEQSAQYWADRYTDPRNTLVDRGIYGLMGGLASLWTPCNSDETLAVLTTALGVGRFASTVSPTGAFPPPKNVTVIGHLPEYVDVAEEMGANYLRPTAQWDWRVQRDFIEGVIKRGDDVLIGTKIRPGPSVLKHEIKQLIKAGYRPTFQGSSFLIRR
jgi:RHS repeat-associated protein